MASTYAVPVVRAAIRMLLVADGTLASLLAVTPSQYGSGPAVWAEGAVPQDATKNVPYLTLGAETEVPSNTMGPSALPKFGSVVTIQIKALTTTRGDDAGFAIMSRVKALLDGTSLAVAGYGTAFAEFDSPVPAYLEAIGNVVHRHHPMIFRVQVHQL
jgi:hypothetical protein